MMHKRRLLTAVLLVVALLLLSGTLLASAQGPALYPGTWRSGIGIKNLTDGSNTISVLFYDAGTGTKQAYEYSTTLDAGAGIELYLPNIPDTDLASGSYAVEVQSVGAVGVMATNTNYDANIADSYNGMESATAFFVPGIYYNHNSWTSELVVQNVNDQAVDAYVKLSGWNPSTSTVVEDVLVGPLNIPARASRSFDTGTTTPFDYGSLIGQSKFIGSATVTNTEGLPMAAALFDTRVAGSSQVVLSYRGMTEAQDADTFLVAPIVYKNFNNGWRSGITVQNVHATEPVTVALTVRLDPALGSFTATSTQHIDAGKSYEWYLPNPGIFDGGASVPDNFKGSGKVEVIGGGGRIVGTVLTTNYQRPKLLSTPPAGVGVALGYIMPSRSSGTALLSAPTVYKYFGTGNWNSSLVVSNVGTDSIQVSLEFASDAGIPVSYNDTLGPFSLSAGESKEFYLPNPALLGGAVIPNGFKGSILVTATGAGTPKISGIVQHTNYGRGVATVYLAAGGSLAP